MKNLFYTLLIFVFAISTLPGVAIVGVSHDADIISHHETTINSALADIPTPSPMGGFAVPLELLDFGDAPNGPYPTLLANDGARHFIDGSTFLGNLVDDELDGQPNASADGDDLANLDDEDGVIFLTSLVAGTPAKVKITASTDGALSAWIDFDQNGSWSEAGNKIFSDKMLVAGDNILTFLVPVGANTGSTYARFRFSSQQFGLSFTGLAENGEVEDYKVEVIENQSIKWIQNPDTEFYGYHAHQQEGPDLWIADDWQCEGGLVTDLHWWGYYEMPSSGLCSGFRISIYDNDASGPYNKPGAQILTWDAPFGTNPGEVGEYFTGRYAISGDKLYYYNFDLPEPFAQIQGNFYWLELMALSADQQNNVLWEWQTNGEPIVLSDPIQFDESGYQGLLDRNMAFIITSQPEGIDNFDFGDAPNGPYPTLLVNDGARHFIDGSTYLGNNVDAEPDGLPNINATGDDLNNVYDEDGVTFISPFVVGKTAEIKVRASKAGLLNAWIDFNLNGSWAETNEHIFSDQTLVAGLNSLTFNIPSTGIPGVSYIRFRFDTNGGLNYYGPAENGEVEDYKLIIYPPDWDYTPTGSSHIISIPKLVSFNCLSLSAGDFLGTFYTDENGNLACGGAAVWDGINNQTIVAFGDDITTTPLKEGFDENEEFLWKAYFSSTGVEEEVLATYNPVFPNSDGKFHDNGISGLTSIIKKMNVLASASPDTICAGDIVQLNALVYGGCGTNTFSWTSNPVGFTSSLQNPTATPSQNTTYTITISNTYGDSAIATVDVMVNPLPEPTCPDDFEICIDEGPVTLSGGLPLGGTFSGTGVTGGVFYPGTAGAGDHIITYTYVEPGTNCAGSCDFKIIVNPLPVMDCPPFMEACEDDPPVMLNTGYPVGGVYTGTSVYFDGANYFFDPGIGAGTYIINYCFTDPNTNCENCCEFNFYVYAKPQVSCPEDFTICYDTAPFTLSGGLPTGGTYSGTGVSGGMFYPATAGVGTHLISYTYIDPQTLCENFCTFKITVILVEATCPDDFEICIDEGPVTLSGGLPLGGNYSGTGVTGGLFYPGTAGAGDHIITYTYVEPGTNCAGSCDFKIIVNPLPVMDCPPFMEACEDDPLVLLNTAYPLGGVYTGTGVSFDGANYFFDPAIGSGTYIILYCFTDPDTNCENCCEFNFYVYAKPQVSCPEDFTICYDTAPFTLSGGIPTGGTYSGTGVSGGMFYPATAGVGTHQISYTYIDPQTLCENFCTFKITVILVEATCPDDFEICIDEGPVTLSGGLPLGGTYSGTGVTAGVFYPGTAGTGSHIITYTYVEPGTNCSGSCDFKIIVNPLPVMDCPPFMEACEDDPPVMLNTGYPVGGEYTGTGVYFDGANYFFDPGIGSGTYIINYCFTDPNTNCENCCEFNFYVYAKPQVSCPEDFTICYDTAPFTLSGGLPTGGTYSGTGVSGGMFYPTTAGVGTHLISYTYIDPQTLCENFCTFKIIVILVEATCPDDFEICIDEGPVTLSGGLPLGGTYSGTGVTGGMFYPGTAGAGDHIITYTYVEPGTNCAGSCDFKIIVNPLPMMDCPPFMEACEDDPPVMLNTGYPVGGEYTGTGVYFDGANYFFDPGIGAGTYIINYCFTDPNTNCENCCEFNFYVYAKPDVTCPEDFAVCLDTAPFILSGGLPTGGIYAGTGVSSGMFNPATAGVGTHLITYTYADPQTNCGDFCTFKITVIEIPEVICPDDMMVCLNDSPLELSGGDPEGGTYGGTGVSGGFFNPAVAGVGTHIITYTVGVAGTNCFGQCEFEITVKPLPILDCPPFMEACEDDPPVLLNNSYPQGGDYTGTGTFFDGFNYFFDPGVGPGVYIINYCFTNLNTGCENCCEFNFIVHAKPVVTCPEDFTICLDTSPFTLSGGLPVGGTYSGTGVASGIFDPATAGVATHEITYTYVDPQTFCENFCTFKITVIEVIVECPDDIMVCIDEPAFALVGGTPTGGTYSGTGVSGGMFYPGTAGVGPHIIVYTYVEPGTNCSGSCNFKITVNPLPLMDCPPFMEACEDDLPVLLNNSYPQGGDYTGTGVFFDGFNYFFDPGVGPGIYIINYCFTNPNTDCENCCEFNFIVHAKPEVSCPEDFAVCLDTPAFTLSGGLPVGGQYSGDGVSFDGTNYWFDPSVAGEGAHEVLYVYTNPQTLCSDMCSFIITVIEVPEVMCPENMMVCLNDDTFELTGATPTGGTYAGPGVSGGFFNPSAAGVGTHVITYTVGVAGTNCFGQCEFEITVKPLPGVDCPGDMEVCLYSPTILLLDDAQPAASYSGEGVFYENGFYYFDPSIGLGEYEITMCNTDPETQCTNCCTYFIKIIADQVISIPEGWSGVSSYIEPLNTDMNLVLYPITYQLTILSNNEGIYWPGGNTFTLTDWDVYSGYVIKVSEDTELPFCGMELVEKTIQLNQGWNIIPVLTSYPYTTETLFNGVQGFEIAKEVAGTGVYWEQYGINNMPVLDPGKAYYVRMSSAGSLTFNLPLDEMPSYELNKPSELLSPWNEIMNTPGSHTVVFNLPELMLEQGDVIGGFTPDGQCAGVVEIDDINKAFTLNLNGDDVFTSVKEGFVTGERFSYKLYRASTGETFELTASYNVDMNTGQFETFGLSEITSLKLSATGISEFLESDVVIYPNPSKDVFNIEGVSINSSFVVFNAFGEEIMGNELIRKGTIDLSSQPNGVYFVRIETANGSFVKKLVKE